MIADDIMTALVTATLGQIANGANDWMIRIGYMNKDPNRSISINYAGGRPPEASAGVGYPNIQIKVRGNTDDGQAVLAKELAIYNFLHGVNAPAVIGAGYVYCLAIQSGPMPLGYDENRRPSYCRNYRIMALTTL